MFSILCKHFAKSVLGVSAQDILIIRLYDGGLNHTLKDIDTALQAVAEPRNYHILSWSLLGPIYNFTKTVKFELKLT